MGFVLHLMARFSMSHFASYDALGNLLLVHKGTLSYLFALQVMMCNPFLPLLQFLCHIRWLSPVICMSRGYSTVLVDIHGVQCWCIKKGLTSRFFLVEYRVTQSTVLARG